MNETILFSPVGGTDPISMNNYKDGAMLHICRVYRPTKVILYMSKEILENQEKDDRYRYALQHLFELQGRENVAVEEICRPELTDVQEFDFFYQEFRNIIGEIFEKMDATDRLLINVSSGTPAMKSGLLVLQTLGEYPAVMIQVRTPARGMNEHTHEGFDIGLLWEWNEDNEENFENRCKEIQCPTLSQIKNEEIIKKHVAVYDYQAAVTVAETMGEEPTRPYIGLLKLAAARILLDFPAADRWQRETGADCMPVKSGDSRKYFEYTLGLSIKLKRKEYVDFIRGITPILADLFVIILKKQCGIDMDEFTKITKRGRQWDRSKENTDVWRVLDQKYSDRGGFRGGDVGSDHLVALIGEYSQDGKLRQLAEELRDVEVKIRNMAAHQIVSINEEKIKQRTGFTGKQIMDKIFAVFSYTDMKIKKDSWQSYDDMNEKIFQAMNAGGRFLRGGQQ